MKTCWKCGETKALDDFHDAPKCKDGKHGQCKSCRNLYNAARRANFTPEQKAREAEQMKFNCRRYRERHGSKYDKLKHAARVAVNDAIRAGKLERKPCDLCGALLVEAHHPDYSKPLDVIWLCVPCHSEHRKKYDYKSLIQQQSVPRVKLKII